MLLACVVVPATPASAAVTKLTVEKTTPMAGGYELLEGHFSGALDPADKHNAIINDIKLAPKNAAGKVEYSATFAIARPTGAIPACWSMTCPIAAGAPPRPSATAMSMCSAAGRAIWMTGLASS